MLLLYLGLSCTTPQPDFIEQWKHDKAQTIEDLRQLQNPMQQLLLVTQLSEAYPGQTQELCSILQDQQGRERCARINERPHLWSKSRSSAKTAVPKTEPSSQQLATECPENALRNSCIDEKSAQAARHGDVNKAAKLCALITPSKWRGECFFHAAEQAVIRRQAYGYDAATSLCQQAQPFVENCQNHLIMRLAAAAPSAHSADPQAWSIIHSAANAIQSTWSWRNAEFGHEAVDRLWSESLGMAYSAVKPVSGDPLDALQAETTLLPHIRAAAMRRLMAIDSPNKHSLKQWISLAKKSLQHREKGTSKRDQQGRFIAVADLWEATSGHPSVAFMATSRRAWSKEEDIDLAICALETAARHPPNHMTLLKEGKEHQHPLIQWTAERLLKKIAQ